MTVWIVIASIVSFQRGDPLAEALTVTAEVATPISGILGIVYGFRGKLPGTKNRAEGTTGN
jgi:hypothetical protein